MNNLALHWSINIRDQLCSFISISRKPDDPRVMRDCATLCRCYCVQCVGVATLKYNVNINEMLKTVYFCFSAHFMINADTVLLSSHYVPVIFKAISFMIFWLNCVEVYIN